MSKDRSITLLSEVMSLATHMAGSAGNVSLMARREVATPDGVFRTAWLSGNALRHRMVRSPGFGWLVDRIGLHGKLSLMQANFLFHGGQLVKGLAGPSEDLRRVADWQSLFPLGRLLGGCLPDQILSGTLVVRPGVLVCRENARIIEHHAGDLAAGGRFRPASAYESGYQYTRGDVAGARGSSEDESNQMIFAGECVIPGAAFIHGFSIQHAEDAELGALLLALDSWEAGGATVGGMSARGHGHLRTAIVSGVDPEEAEACKAAYVAHVDANKDACVEWLNRTFAKVDEKIAAKAEKASKGKKGKAATAEPEPVEAA